jgi:hypothetical protein
MKTKQIEEKHCHSPGDGKPLNRIVNIGVKVTTQAQVAK